MRVADIKRFEKEVRELYKDLESYKLVAETLSIKTAEVIHLLLDTEEGTIKYFEKRPYSDFPMLNFN